MIPRGTRRVVEYAEYVMNMKWPQFCGMPMLSPEAARFLEYLADQYDACGNSEREVYLKRNISNDST